MIFNVNNFGLERFICNIIYLFNNKDRYDFQIEITYCVIWIGDFGVGSRSFFRLLSIDDKEKLINDLYNKIYKSINDSDIAT